jgi:hypothetical protein
LGPEYPSDSTLSLGSSTTRDTCVSPALVPSVRSVMVLDLAAALPTAVATIT